MTLIKICGVVDPEDASMALDLGASFIGMILSMTSKSSVNGNLAKEIACAVKEKKRKIVGVFVDAEAKEIESKYLQYNLDFCQLHGPIARESLNQLSGAINKIYVRDTDPEGNLMKDTSFDKSLIDHDKDYILYDLARNYKREPFSYKQFVYPKHERWLLAGGLTPFNVSYALETLHPPGVDVSSSLTLKDGLRKSKDLLYSFFEAIRIFDEQES